MKVFFIGLLFVIPSVAMYAQTEEQLVEWYHKGNSAFVQGEYQDALLYIGKINDIYEKNEGQIQITRGYGDILYILAESNDQLENYSKAVEYGKKVVKIYKSTIGENHPDYATSLQNLANYLFDNEEYSLAIEYGSQALEKRKAILGENHPDYAQSLYNLVNFYSNLGDYVKAVECGNKALVTCKNTLGESDSLYIELLENLSDYNTELGNYSKAIELKETSSAIQKTKCGENSIEYALSLQEVADYYSSPIGDQAKAIEYEMKILNIIRTNAGMDNFAYSMSLNHLASYYNKLGDYSKAIENGLSSANITKKVFGEDNPSYITTLNNVSCYYSNNNDINKAVEFATQAMKIRKETRGEKKVDYAVALDKIARYQAQQGHFDKAIEYLTISSRVYKDILGENHPDYAASLNNLAFCYSGLGNYDKAVELEKRSIELSNTFLKTNDSEYIPLDNLAGYYFKLGDYANAVAYKIKAVNVLKETLGERSSDYAVALRDLADYYSYLGDYPKAIENGVFGMQMIKQTLGEYHPDYATSLTNLALYYYFIGDYGKAVEYGNQSINLYHEVIGGNYSGYSASLSNLSIYFNALGDYRRALEYGLKAENVYKTRYGDNDHDYAAILSNLANYYSNDGDYKKAIECVTKSLSIIGENDYYYSTCLINLANYYSYLGNFEKAKEYGIKAINHCKTILGENHIDNAHIFDMLAFYYSGLGDYSRAYECIQQSTSVIRSNTLQFFGNLSSNLRSSFWLQNSFHFTDLYPSFYYRTLTESTSDLYDKSALFAKGILLTTEMEMNKLIQESGDNEALKMYQELRRQRLHLKNLYNLPLSERDHDADSLALASDQLERELVVRSKVYGDFTRKLRTTWQDVQKSLDNDEIAVEFLSFNIFGTDSTMVAALTLRKDDQEPKFIPLFELRQLQGVSDPKHFICPEVTDLVWEPLRKELHGIRRVYFSPAGVLHKIAVEYVPGMESYELYRLSTTREIIDMKESYSSIEEFGTTTLYGGVDYESLDTSNLIMSADAKKMSASEVIVSDLSPSRHRAFVDSLNIRGMKVNYLPSTLTEVKNIQESLKGIHCPVMVHVGSEASENSVKSLSGKAPYALHLATHGFYFTEKQAKMNHNLLFLVNKGNRNIDMEDKALTRSGLFMAGVNKTLRNDVESMSECDGILTAREISKLDLRETNLVVLSACETGKGDIMQGEGVFGLQRAFKMAGAGTIVMSLWKVHDDATSLLMTHFYKNLTSGDEKHKALWKAMMDVKEKYEDPYYWAGFIILD